MNKLYCREGYIHNLDNGKKIMYEYGKTLIRKIRVMDNNCGFDYNIYLDFKSDMTLKFILEDPLGETEEFDVDEFVMFTILSEITQKEKKRRW